jgi:hypothetical protein
MTAASLLQNTLDGFHRTHGSQHSPNDCRSESHIYLSFLSLCCGWLLANGTTKHNTWKDVDQRISKSCTVDKTTLVTA